MRILIASDSFKGCMSSMEANHHIRDGLRRADPGVHTDLFAVSDGGEGMTDAFARAFHCEMRTLRTCDLYGRPITISWAYDAAARTACLEAASMLGVTLYPYGRRQPMKASSYGLGKAVLHLARHPEVDRVIIGLGGTGTSDGGMGFAAAFGAVFYDRMRQKLDPCAASLARIAFIDKRHFHIPHKLKLTAACDVKAPLCGAHGAAFGFGRQKGLRPSQIQLVDKGLALLSAKIDQTFHVHMDEIPSAGAAGGLGGMLCALFGAKCVSGIDLLMESGHLREVFRQADLVITGEGQSDAQSAQGKVVCRIGQLAKSVDTPCIVLCGAVAQGFEQLYEQGVDAIFPTADRAMSFTYALRHGPEKLEFCAYNVMRLIQVSQRRFSA